MASQGRGSIPAVGGAVVVWIAFRLAKKLRLSKMLWEALEVFPPKADGRLNSAGLPRARPSESRLMQQRR